MTRRVKLVGMVLSVFLAWPTAARAQSAITGTVRDTSGAVLPGVTVEASSDALIEKSKTAVTDGQGRYLFGGLIVNLIPLFIIKWGSAPNPGSVAVPTASSPSSWRSSRVERINQLDIPSVSARQIEEREAT